MKLSKEEKFKSLKEFLPNVSRETFEKLLFYENEVQKWQSLVQLVSSADEQNIWTRHILDSAQFFLLLKGEVPILDLGSGGGFPAIVISILGENESTKEDRIRQKPKLFMVESQQKKASFLQKIVANLELPAKVYNNRIEQLDPQAIKYKIITARALASLKQLCHWTRPFFEETSCCRCFFAKGESYKKEIEEAQNYWQFGYKMHINLLQKNAVILELYGLKAISKKV